MALTRKVLLAQLSELQSRLEAAGGETRKSLRERVARTTAELAEARKAREEAEKTLQECATILVGIKVEEPADLVATLDELRGKVKKYHRRPQETSAAA